MKDRSALSEESEGFRFLVGQDPAVRDPPDNLVADKSDRFPRGSMLEGAGKPFLIPQGPAITQDVLHHITDKPLVLFELPRIASELRLFFLRQYLSRLTDELRPGLRR